MILVTQYTSPYFGQTFVVDYCVNGGVNVIGVKEAFLHAEYEVLEVDTDKYVRDRMIDYHLLELHEAIETGNARQALEAEYALWWLRA